MAVPHFSYPFRLTGSGSVAVVEQDTTDEIAQCVQAIISTDEGSRVEIPEFGVRSLLGTSYRATLPNEILRKVQQFEPRAVVDLDLTVDKIDDLIRYVNVTVRGGAATQTGAVMSTSGGPTAPSTGSGWGLTPWGTGPWGE
jgi:phage baseplate assembly protein W